MSCDKGFLSQNLSHHTAVFILTYKGECERIFSVAGFCEFVQYLSACNIANYYYMENY